MKVTGVTFITNGVGKEARYVYSTPPLQPSAGDPLRTLLSIDELLIGSIVHEDFLFLLGGASTGRLPSGVSEEDAEPSLQDAQEEYAEKFMIGSQPADAKIAANLLREVERYGFINKVASEHDVESLKSLLAENQTMYESMSSRVTESRQKEVSRNKDLVTPAPPRKPSGDASPPSSSHCA